MKVNGSLHRGVSWIEDGAAIEIIDQRELPHAFRFVALRNLDEVARAIAEMWLRGAPLIGAVAACGVALQMRHDAGDAALDAALQQLAGTRPTAINLRWALERMEQQLRPLPAAARARAARQEAETIAAEDVRINRAIGEHGLELIRRLAADKAAGEPVRILTHCNAGWLATVDYGTATAPIYLAHDAGLAVHVFVDETRPRNQGAALTAWELANHGVPHTLIVDNAGGHLMQHGEVDLVLVGTDRVTSQGDVCNKIGTYLKALAARDNGVPFYVALPSPTIDWTIRNGLEEIPIEERGPEEVHLVQGRADDGRICRVRISPAGSPARNPAFDVTPARLVTGLITELGIVPASEAGLRTLRPD